MKQLSPSAKRLLSLHDGVVRLGPHTIHIDITNSCNTDCVTCWDHSPHLSEVRPASWKRQRVTVEHVRALLDDVESLGGLEAVIVSGMGEPFTHPDIYAIIQDMKQRGLHLTIITNLVAADDERILELGVDQLLIGIHGASERAYLDFHPSFSAKQWTRLQAMLMRFKEAGRRFKHVQVICACNAHELVDMVDQAHGFDAEQLNFKFASLREGTEAVRVSDSQRAWLLEEGIAHAAARASELGVKTNLDVFRLQVETGGEATAPIEDVGCFLGYTYSRITVDGTVLYCCNTEVVVGQLSETTSFSDLWNGAAWNALRTRLRNGEYFPGCAQCGKFNQNVKLSERFKKAFGDTRWLEVTGRGPDRLPTFQGRPTNHPLRVMP